VPEHVKVPVIAVLPTIFVVPVKVTVSPDSPIAIADPERFCIVFTFKVLMLI
jgi:hypothetical protein